MRIQLVGHRHRASCGGVLPKKAKRVWRRWGLTPSDGAVIAKDKDRLVGFLRFGKMWNGGLRALGTWVAPAYRGRGIADRLWGTAIRRLKIKRVRVYTASVGGRELVKSLRKKHRSVRFYTGTCG